MDSNETSRNADRAGHARAPYETPRLIEHGTLAEITRDIGKNSGAGDVDQQSGGAG